MVGDSLFVYILIHRLFEIVKLRIFHDIKIWSLLIILRTITNIFSKLYQHAKIDFVKSVYIWIPQVELSLEPSKYLPAK